MTSKDKLRGCRALRKEAGRRSDRGDGGGGGGNTGEKINRWRERGRRSGGSHRGDNHSL